ncbi:MAG: Gfo/Idh/MocA family oxidoreductase [Ruminococcaceae bacterium]|nr:Gfo/Idh/MocA family oxidoreductase [Oscillospiraceae bacterium]
MKAVKFAIIGAGGIANQFVKAVNNTDKAEVIMVASKDMERAKNFAERNSIPSFGTYEEVYNNPEVEAVYVSTTHNFHHGIIIDALNHGKHVLCEKAMVLSEKEAADVINLSREKNLLLMEAMWSRHNPCVKKVKEWIGSGKIGKLVTGFLSWGFEASHDPKHRLINPDLAGGAAWDIGVYALLTTDYVIGKKPLEVKTLCHYGETGVDMIDHYALKYDDAIVSLTVNLCCNMPFLVGFNGTKGYIKADGLPFAGKVSLYDSSNNLIEEFVDPNERGMGVNVNGFIYQVEEAARCIREGLIESPVVPHGDSLWSTKIYDILLSEK